MIKETLTLADKFWTYKHTSGYAMIGAFSYLGNFPSNTNNKNY
jgi:hypothetical protein